MVGYVFTGVSRTTSWCQFKSDCHQTLSVIPLATGDKVIKSWKVKVDGEVCALLNALLVTYCYSSERAIACAHWCFDISGWVTGQASGL